MAPWHQHQDSGQALPSRRLVPRHCAARQRGQMGIVGVVLAIALAATVLASIIRFASVYRQQHIAEAAASQLTTMLANTKKLYANVSTGYQNVTPAVLIASGVIPAEAVNGSNITALGSNVQVSASSYAGYGGSGPGSGITFTYQVPQNLCPLFVKGAADEADVVSINLVSVKNDTQGLNTVNPTTVGFWCTISSVATVMVTIGQ